MLSNYFMYKKSNLNVSSVESHSIINSFSSIILLLKSLLYFLSKLYEWWYAFDYKKCLINFKMHSGIQKQIFHSSNKIMINKSSYNYDGYSSNKIFKYWESSIISIIQYPEWTLNQKLF